MVIKASFEVVKMILIVNIRDVLDSLGVPCLKQCFCIREFVGSKARESDFNWESYRFLKCVSTYKEIQLQLGVSLMSQLFLVRFCERILHKMIQGQVIRTVDLIGLIRFRDVLDCLGFRHLYKVFVKELTTWISGSVVLL